MQPKGRPLMEFRVSRASRSSPSAARWDDTGMALANTMLAVISSCCPSHGVAGLHGPRQGQGDVE